jgi:hypothetical protein
MNHRNRLLLFLVMVCLVLVCSLVLPEQNQAQSRPAADLIITNAKIWTVDKSLPLAQAVAILGGRCDDTSLSCLNACPRNGGLHGM